MPVAHLMVMAHPTDPAPGIMVAGIVAPGVAIRALATGLVAIEARMEIIVLSAICLAAAETVSGACILMNG